MQIWTLRIERRHGDDVSVHRTNADAVAALAEYAREWWDDQRARGADLSETCPSDDETAIEMYFDAETDEFYSIDSAPLPLTYEDIEAEALALSKDDKYRLGWALDQSLGSFTMVTLDVDSFFEDILNGDWEDAGLHPDGVRYEDAYDAIAHVAREADAPEDYRYNLETWAVQLMTCQEPFGGIGHTPLLVPMWCAGLGG